MDGGLLEVGDCFLAEAEGLEQLGEVSRALVLEVQLEELMRVEEEVVDEEEEVFLSIDFAGVGT